MCQFKSIYSFIAYGHLSYKESFTIIKHKKTKIHEAINSNLFNYVHMLNHYSNNMKE